MLQDGTVWFLVADGRRARVLVQLRRGGPLDGPGGWQMEIEKIDLYESQDRPPRLHDRMGDNRHAMTKGPSLHEQEELNFLRRVADRVGQSEKEGAFDHLVITAPPRALGELRQLLPHAVQARIRAEAHKDVVDENPDRLRERLQELLRG